MPALEQAAALSVRFLDDALEVNRLPLPEVEKATRLTRKIGLGVMGFADLLIELGIPYDSSGAADLGQKNHGRHSKRRKKRQPGACPRARQLSGLCREPGRRGRFFSHAERHGHHRGPHRQPCPF